MEEIWKDIKGYEGLYQVSNFGRVKTLPRIIRNSSNGRYYTKEKILKLGKQTTGYLYVCLYKNNTHKTHRIHRLVAEAFIANPENKLQVNHIDGNKTNNHVSNLEWVTRKENMKHAYKIGLTRGYKGHKHSKLTKDKWSEKRKGSNNPNARKVICITTQKIYDCIKDATIEYNLDRHYITRCCTGKQRTAGKLLDGTKLEWMYYDDYLKQIEKGE